MHLMPAQRVRVWALCFLLAAFALAFAPQLSRAQDFRGSIVGVVQDATGARIPAAKISIHAAESSLERQTSSDASGGFRLEDLMPGTYRVIVSAPGFADAQSDVRVIVSTVQSLTVTLKPAPLRQSVSVQANASSIATEPLDAANTVQGGAVTSQDLETIPLAHRSFANIAYLVPGTEPVEPSDPTKARISAVSFGGSSGLNDVLSVDGGDNSDDFIGGFLQNFSPDAIQEFAVRTSQENADTGRTVGGSVVITTRRGTNDLHGNAAFYERAAALNARFPIENPAPLPKQPFSRQNYVATLGGPLRHDRLWFFGSFEAVHENASIAYSPASLAQFNALASLASQGLIPSVPSIAVPNNVPIPFRDYMGATRFDFSQSSKSQWFLRAAVDNFTTRNAFVQQATLPSTGATSHDNYLSLVLGQQYIFSPTWLGSFTFAAGGLHLTESRNSNFGFALAFPFSSTFQTISGFETFGDNQFVTPITAFPVLRNQEKYQFRYAVTHSSGAHAPSFGIDFIHEPVLSGALPGNAETLLSYANDPSFYAANPSQFYFSLTCKNPAPPSGVTCTPTPAGNGSFSQDVQRLGLYAEDSWHAAPHLTVNYGLRYDTTFGLFTASGQSQLANPALATLAALQIPLFAKPGAPHDYRAAIAPRLGVAYSLDGKDRAVVRAGVGLFYNDLAQNGWVTAFQAVNSAPGVCVNPGDPGCIPGGGRGALIDPSYKTPYALHATAGIEDVFDVGWLVSADWTHEQGVHSYRRYSYLAGFTLNTPISGDASDVPNIDVFRTDNRSRYDALSVHLQGSMAKRFDLVFNYTLSSADTWGCVLGELFDYVNGVCDPLDAFRRGDYGPSGEDVRHRAVLGGTLHAPGGFEISTLTQLESARPFTLTTPVDVNGFGDVVNDRAVVNGIQTSLDQLRGAPYIQSDLRVTRAFKFRDRYTLLPYIEFFNLFNRNNPGANYVTNIAALPGIAALPMPTLMNDLSNATVLCADPPACSSIQPITSPNQLRVPAGGLGDFFGPGTTVGIPFAAQLGLRLSF